MKHIETEKIYKSVSVCQNCVYKTHPVMLSTYALRGFPCDACGNVTDLAMVIERDNGKADDPCLTAMPN